MICEIIFLCNYLSEDKKKFFQADCYFEFCCMDQLARVSRKRAAKMNGEKSVGLGEITPVLGTQANCVCASCLTSGAVIAE